MAPGFIANVKNFFQPKKRTEETEDPLIISTADAPVGESSDGNQPPPRRQGFGRWTSLNAEEFLTYCRKFAFACFWVFLLLINYGIGRLFVKWELPSDAEEGLDAYDVYYSMNNLLLYGLVLAWFTGIIDYERAIWLFHWKRWYFFVLLFTVSPIYSWISNAESLKHSFEDIGDWGGAMWSVIVLAIIVVAITIIWHLHFAWKNHSPYGLLVYILSRIVVILYYWMFAIAMDDTHHRDVHLHHYFTTWMAALFAEFNHPISAMLLGTMSSIFVQGIAAYGFAPIFKDEECFSITTGKNATCYYWAQEEFTMNMCPGKHDDIKFKCYAGLRHFSNFDEC